SVAAFEARTRARARPRSKADHVTLGDAVVANDLVVKKRLPRPAKNPTKAATLTCGNSWATATPCRSVAAERRRSAARTSGRRLSKSLAFPIGNALSIGA